MVRYEKASSSGYSIELEAAAQAWVEEVTEQPFQADFGEELRDGTRLCQLMNAIKPGFIRRISTSKVPFKQMENVSNFIRGCRAVGVPEYSLFETVDLFELKDLGLVVKCLHALGGTVQTACPDFKGPHLGVKAAPRLSPNQKRPSPTKPAVRSPSGVKAPTASNPEVVKLGQAYPTHDVPTPPTFNGSKAPESSSDEARLPPPPFDESASMWSGSGKSREPDHKKPIAAGPPNGGMAGTNTEEVVSRFSQAVHVANDTPTIEGIKAGAQQLKYSGPTTPPYHRGAPSLSAMSTEPAQSFSPGTQTATMSPDSSASSANSRPAPVTVARGGGYGLDAELAEKREANYDHRAEQDAQEWIEVLTREPFADEFGEELRNGRRLCMLINAIKPGAVRRVNDSRMPFKQMENISNFLKACRAVGVAEHSLFETVDLFEGKDLGLVVRCLHALGQTVQTTCPEFDGPFLGIKHTETNKRDWTPEQQQRQALYSAGSMSHVMAGSSKTMERGTIIKEGVTFGATTCGAGDTSVSTPWTMGSQATMERLTVTKTGPTFGAEYAGTGDPHSSSSMFTRR